MPIPDFQTVMQPLLRLISDGRDCTASQAVEALAAEFKLTEAEKAQLLPSGRQAVFNNRIAWAKTHLRMAGLIEPRERGVFRITARGQEVLRANPTRIDLRLLSQEPGYNEARFRKARRDEVTVEVAPVEASTPEERIGEAVGALREALVCEILLKLGAASPQFFERVVVELLVRMGYGGTQKDAGQAIGRSGDGGIDGIIKEDRLGLDAIYIQAKRWQGTVGRPEIQQFAGALQGMRARKGVFITTSDFPAQAVEYAGNLDSKIVLIDGEQLAALMIDFGLGVATVETYQLKRIDGDFFAKENE